MNSVKISALKRSLPFKYDQILSLVYNLNTFLSSCWITIWSWITSCGWISIWSYTVILFHEAVRVCRNLSILQIREHVARSMKYYKCRKIKHHKPFFYCAIQRHIFFQNNLRLLKKLMNFIMYRFKIPTQTEFEGNEPLNWWKSEKSEKGEMPF